MRRKTVQINRLGIEISRLELLKPKHFVREYVADRKVAWALEKTLGKPIHRDSG